MCTVVLTGWDHATPPPFPLHWAHIRRRCWSAKIDDISLWPPAVVPLINIPFSMHICFLLNNCIFIALVAKAKSSESLRRDRCSSWRRGSSAARGGGASAAERRPAVAALAASGRTRLEPASRTAPHNGGAAAAATARDQPTPADTQGIIS